MYKKSYAKGKRAKPGIRRKIVKNTRRPNKTSFAKKVMSVVNTSADKKDAVSTITGGLLGQFQALTTSTWSNGYQFINIPCIATGTSDSGRIGNKIHLTGMQIRAQFVPQDFSQLVAGQRVRMIVFRAKGVNPLISTPTNYLKGDPMYSVSTQEAFTYLSDRNTDYMSDFITICDKKFKVPLKNTGTQQVVLDLKVNLKLNFDQHMYGTGENAIADGQMYVLLLTDMGNSGPITYANATPNFLIKTASTGLQYNLSIHQYWTDV